MTAPHHPPAATEAALSPGRALTMAELRSCQLDLLAAIDEFAARHRIRYWLTYGTLLGAVRHQGYIPWDDDVDVMMPRADYDRFAAGFAAEHPAGRHELRSAHQDPTWPHPFAKVCDVRTTLHEHSTAPVVLGVNVDVFPVDVLAQTRVRRAARAARIDLLRRMHTALSISPDPNRARAKAAALWCARRVLARCSLPGLARRWSAAARRPAPWTATSHAGIQVGSYRWSVPVAALEPGRALPFEHLTPMTPADADLVLRTMYGEYRTPPDPAAQVSHHRFNAHWGSSAHCGELGCGG